MSILLHETTQPQHISHENEKKVRTPFNQFNQCDLSYFEEHIATE